jgi:hypothetical protein
VKIWLGDFNAKVGREYIFKHTIWNGSLHKISKDNRVRVVNFTTSEKSHSQSTTFPQHNIHKYTWMSQDGKTYDQIVHILIDG